MGFVADQLGDTVCALSPGALGVAKPSRSMACMSQTVAAVQEWITLLSEGLLFDPCIFGAYPFLMAFLGDCFKPECTISIHIYQGFEHI